MISYRLMEPRDMDAVSDLLRAFHAESWVSQLAEPDEAAVQRQLADIAGSNGALGVIVVSEIDGEVVGAASAVAHALWLNPQSPYAVEQFVYVKKEKRVGVGRGLVRALEAFLTCLGFKGLFLLSGDGDPRAGKLFERLGYEMKSSMFFKPLGVA
jgi:predicted N-acetyltransferase YhbS